MNYKKEAKYEALLQSAIELISEKGYQKTSVGDIVKKAGVAQGTFYIYFPTKNDIVPAVAEHILEHLLSLVQAEAEPLDSFWDKLKAVIGASFDMTSKYKEVILLCYSGLALHHSFPKWEAIYQPYYDWFAEQLAAARQNGEVSLQSDSMSVVRMIINMIEQTAETYYFVDIQQGRVDPQPLKDELFSFIQRSLK
ncbi:TetR family transcriptional regulator [Paenibacillus apiarius]|uniref:TetR family transcriptional regulator n=1 Tax=Paenibacillus apiarius TaxID=46240 RepID=A0ABT4DRL0_9BACL|nr:TetR family transcriptional regulator [Paenibacillus apiarius]MBN3524523.1 TetR family transcriptional regulator [Paenibacillus apiarius]MCY9516359.1 TetR family transcriptional regulator [Paenibacillus apiarius]MCY9519992.1 TetR family transcriptional regulator [Paenibacillus apiarius]MCY9554385.1 TetR family transcriptional regulator [Paenibacillus apiarius]MCY9558176.1 TetR family transcriptional regulator [Paenibacillus apiarius]